MIIKVSLKQQTIILGKQTQLKEHYRYRSRARNLYHATKNTQTLYTRSAKVHFIRA